MGNRKGRPRAAFASCSYFAVSSPDFLADFFVFFFGAILSFDLSVLLMSLCAAGPVVPPALSDVCANAGEARKARAVAARISLRIGWISQGLGGYSSFPARLNGTGRAPVPLPGSVVRERRVSSFGAPRWLAMTQRVSVPHSSARHPGSALASLACPGPRGWDGMVVTPRSRGMICPSFASTLSLDRRGSGECRVRAAPAVSCASLCEECAHEHTGSAEAIRHSLRNGLTAYAVLSPATNSYCHRRWRMKADQARLS